MTHFLGWDKTFGTNRTIYIVQLAPTGAAALKGGNYVGHLASLPVFYLIYNIELKNSQEYSQSVNICQHHHFDPIPENLFHGLAWGLVPASPELLWVKKLIFRKRKGFLSYLCTFALIFLCFTFIYVKNTNFYVSF